MNFSKGPVDFLEKQISQVGSENSLNSTQNTAEDEARKFEEQQQLQQTLSNLKAHHQQLSEARLAWVDRNNQWNDFFKTQKKQFDDISTKISEIEKQNSKNKTKTINLTTSFNNYQKKVAEKEEEIKNLDKQ